jgi:hypothetical protein
MSYIKKTNLCMNISLFTGHIFCLFYRCHIKCSLLSKTCVPILNVQIYMVNLFLEFFNIWNWFFNIFFIIDLYTPESQNTSSANLPLLQVEDVKRQTRCIAMPKVRVELQTYTIKHMANWQCTIAVMPIPRLLGFGVLATLQMIV